MGVEFVNINVSTTGLYTTSTRDYGTVAVVGNGGTSNTTPVKIGSYSEATATFSTTALGNGVRAALLNGASKVWAVDCGTPTLQGVTSALESLEGYDIQVVALAGIVETADDAYISDALCDHVYAAATERVGVFQLGAEEDITTVPTAITGMLTANKSRMFGIAHNSTSEVACAVAGLISKLKPWESPLLKGITGVVQTIGFTNAQIAALETAQINVLVDPIYITGEGYVLGSDFVMGSAVSGVSFIDTRRVIDDIAYKLKAGLTDPNIIGEVRINKTGLATLINRLSGILQTCVNVGEIEDYNITLPVLNALSKDESSRSTAEALLITTARTSRAISGTVQISYAGVLHTINLDVNIVA